ncbi:hypothetical protein OHA09_36165 [Streptomyces longwoodensis]|uniref:hypothetical protein n=1 Tax=Streptomyces longwoodensis TaxID=68231 RepID=UPI002E8230B6|nr:hypothetical protein [Streptomyces longwoodensis]WUC55731.1 hypothetical protein OHA09_00810 [Streptomyces longwoodensis]WUC62150.1 hypothetical protein OHA09_36165 [Streptomyces longwoodensis]
MSRRRHAVGAAMPAPHPAVHPQAVVVIVIVLAAWLTARGVDPAVIVQVLGGVAASSAVADGRLPRYRRITPAGRQG